MTPQPGQHVTVTLRNGLRIDGRVVSWSDSLSAIESPGGLATVVIQRTSEDVLMVAITHVKEKLAAVARQPTILPDDSQGLLELKGELLRLEREEVRERLTQHVPSGHQPTYQTLGTGLPTVTTASPPTHGTHIGLPAELLPVSNPVEHSGAQAPRANPRFGSELSRVFQAGNRKDRTGL